MTPISEKPASMSPQIRTNPTTNLTPLIARLLRSQNSLGEESVRDGRPTTKDEVVEAKDEMPRALQARLEHNSLLLSSTYIGH